jgi:hypothetical protein
MSITLPNAERLALQLQAHSAGVDPLCEPEHPLLLELMTYWRGRHRDGGLPARADIDPLHFPKLLPNIFLVDVLKGPPHFRFRLMGTRLAETYGIDITGKSVSEALPSTIIGVVEALYRQVAEKRQPIRTYGKLIWLGKHHIAFESIHLPLAGTGGNVDMLFGGTVFMSAVSNLR